MVIGFRNIELYMPQAQSLKEKRQILRHIKDTVKTRFNVSFAEVGYQDKWQRCSLGLVSIASKRSDVDGRLESIVRMIENDDRISVLNVERDYL